MKRIFCLLLAFCMALCLAACGEKEAPATTPEASGTPLPTTAGEPAPEESPAANTFTVGNLTVAYPNGAELRESDGSFELLLAGENAAMYFETAETSVIYSARDSIENGEMNDMVQESLEQQEYAVRLIEAPQVTPLLDTRAVYSFYEASANEVTRLARFYLFSDGIYDYTVTSSIGEQYNDDYGPWVEQIIERLSWENPPPPPGMRVYEDEAISFEYPARYAEWSRRTMTDGSVLEALMRLVPENDGYWESDLDSFRAQLYDREGAGASLVPRINMQLIDVPGATEEALHEPALLQAMQDQLNAEHPGMVWHREPSLEQHGDRTFVVLLAETTIGKKSFMYQATYTWEDRMVTFVLAAPPELFDDDIVAEIEAMLSSLQIMPATS